jgi:phosphatidate phosphatase PAH1
VSLWRFDDATSSWQSLGRTITAEDGSYAFELGNTFDAGSHKVWAVFEAGRTCYTHSLMVWPEGTQFVLSDIDGTLTQSDDELFAEIGDPTYDQQTKGSAIELIQAWDDKGYGLVYLTARPGDFRPMTEAWKARRGLPHGLTQFAFSLVFDATARAYKAEFISTLLNDMQWEIVAAYGNATSDIEAYADAGIPLDVTFIIGEHAGESGTVAIPNDDYAAHIAEWVAVQPDATAPAP